MSTSRVSTSQMFTNAQGHVANAREREQLSGEKAATQKEINRPSQDPAGWMLATSLKDDQSVRDTLAKNAQVASHVLTATETIFEQAQNYVTRAYELTIGASGTPMGGPSAREFTLAEVKGIYDGLLQAFNFRFGSRTLMAGYGSQGPAFDSSGQFVGDRGILEIDIDKDLRIPLTMSAERHVLGAGSAQGVNILDTLQRLMDGLTRDDTNVVNGTIEDLKRGIEQLSAARAEIGTRMQTLDRAVDRHTTHGISSKEQISKIEDADAIKVFSDLARDQTILKAAISTSERILSQNPTDLFFK